MQDPGWYMANVGVLIHEAMSWLLECDADDFCIGAIEVFISVVGVGPSPFFFPLNKHVCLIVSPE